MHRFVSEDVLPFREDIANALNHRLM